MICKTPSLPTGGVHFFIVHIFVGDANKSIAKLTVYINKNSNPKSRMDQVGS